MYPMFVCDGGRYPLIYIPITTTPKYQELYLNMCCVSICYRYYFNDISIYGICLVCDVYVYNKIM